MNLFIESIKEEEILKYLPNTLIAYEKFILAGIELQKLCNNEDDFKDFLYTKQDYENKKPVHKLFISAIQNPEVVRKDTQSFIKEVIKASGLEQTDPKLIAGFRKFKDSWLQLLAELKKIPNNIKPDLITHLKTVGKDNSSVAEEFKLYENLWD